MNVPKCPSATLGLRTDFLFPNNGQNTIKHPILEKGGQPANNKNMPDNSLLEAIAMPQEDPLRVEHFRLFS
ncbi:hypothetical protein Mgra_00005792 [Meloidogyne graminicola]|uniref:Uncharacterized protein n=1 Tax=Meloidogyne graminicola TaxID=189291 RepID=A0A8S9ZNK1_9BILA|nr:hypothetical protein Mgra_00005792 [Meloidogyne graminicola]